MKYEACVIEGCARKNYGKKYCVPHGNRNRDGLPMDGTPRDPKRCARVPCTGEVIDRGLCVMHYNAVRAALKAVADVRRVPAKCTEPGCDRDSLARGLCPSHYMKSRPKPCGCVECGDAQTRLRDDDGDPVCRACSIELSTPARRSA